MNHCANEAAVILKKLADYRHLEADDLASNLNNDDLNSLLYTWHLAGYLHFSD